MRLPRTTLLARLTGADVAPVVVLEAPPGYGKSWLARRAAGSGVLRLRGELGPLACGGPVMAASVLIDDAHLLSDDDVEVLREHIEGVAGQTRLIIAGRLVADAIHEATELVDGLSIDSEALSITPQEIVRVIAMALDQAGRDPSADAVAVASRMVRAASETALHQLDVRQRSVVALLGRAPGIDIAMLDRLGGAGFVHDAVAVGVPLRRQITGALELAAAAALR